MIYIAAFNFIQWIMLIQYTFILSAIGGFYLLRLVLKFNDHKCNIIIQKITHILITMLHEPRGFSNDNVYFFKKHLRELLQCMAQFEETMPGSATWIVTRRTLSALVLKPQARLLSGARHWLQQYLAVLCYSYGTDPEDLEILAQLVQSNTLLVALNAAKVIFNHPTVNAINAVLDVFAKGRHAQHGLCAEIIIQPQCCARSELEDIVMRLLNAEANP